LQTTRPFHVVSTDAFAEAWESGSVGKSLALEMSSYWKHTLTSEND